MADEAPGLSPPWVSQRTVLSQIERMEKEGVPSKIDKHFLVGMAGGTQNHFRHALRSLGLIDDDSRPTQLLYDMVEKPSQRPELFGNALFSRFPEFNQLPPNASKSDFFALLDGYGVKGADQQRKVLSFYVATADYAGVPVSPHIRPSKAHPGPRKAGTRRRRTSTGTGTVTSPDGVTGDGAAPTAERRVVTLGSAGTVSINVNVRWLDLSDKQFTALRKLIKDIEALAQPSDDAATETAKAAEELS